MFNLLLIICRNAFFLSCSQLIKLYVSDTWVKGRVLSGNNDINTKQEIKKKNNNNNNNNNNIK